MAKNGLSGHKDGKVGGYLVGRKHTQGGIKARNIDTGDPIELESEEVVITAPAVKSSKKHDFDGEQLTNLEILDRINVSGGGVGLMAQGGQVQDSYRIACCGKKYKYGGRELTDRAIVQKMADDDYLDEPGVPDPALESTHVEVIMEAGGDTDGEDDQDRKSVV